MKKERLAGFYTHAGNTYIRQSNIKSVLGSETTVSFSQKIKHPCRFAIIEADNLQPSHIMGIINPLHFIPEAQPKDRAALSVSHGAAQIKLRTFDADQLILSAVAFTGAPIVNERGEVIQGNGRSDLLKLVHTDKTANLLYIRAIEKYQTITGIESLEGFINPVLVRIIFVSDEQAILLGQMMDSEINDTVKQGSENTAKVNKLTTDQVCRLSDIIYPYITEDETLKSVIRIKGEQIVSLLQSYEVVRETETELYLNKSGITPYGIDQIYNLFRGMLFYGCSTSLINMFDKLSYTLKQGFEKSLPKILASKVSLLPIIQESIELIYSLEAGKCTLYNYLNTPDIFEGEMMSKYSRVAIALTNNLLSISSQKGIVSVFKNLVDAINGQAPDLFNPSGTPGMSLDECINTFCPLPSWVSPESKPETLINITPEPIATPIIEPAKATDPEIMPSKSSNDLELIDYTEKSVVLKGNTFPIKEAIKQLGGKFNVFTSSDGSKFKGWVFPKYKKEAIINTLF